MKIKNIMHEIKRMPPNVSVLDVAMFMGMKETGSVLIEDKGEPLGIITERDVLRKVYAKNLKPSEIRAMKTLNQMRPPTDPISGIGGLTRIRANPEARPCILF